MQRREYELEEIVGGFELNRRRPLQRLLQGRVRSDRHRLAVDLKVGEHDRGNERIVLDEPGMKRR